MIAINNLKRLLTKQTRKQFSTMAANGEVNALFTEFISNRKKRLETEKAYVHPLQDADKPINFNVDHILQLGSEFLGPEQVSMHYESFWTSRKYVLSAIASMTTLGYLYKVSDLNWVLYSMINGIPLFFLYFVYFYELPKYQFLPFLNNFYIQTIENEVKMMQNAVPDEVPDLVSKNMVEALDQFDYLLLHKKFVSVKQQSIENFLTNQELELKQSVKERAHDLLAMTQDFEKQNQRQLLGSLVKNIQTEIDNIQKNPNKDILDAAFESALIGMKEGKMSYKNDLVLPSVVKKVHSEVAKIKNLKPEELIN